MQSDETLFSSFGTASSPPYRRTPSPTRCVIGIRVSSRICKKPTSHPSASLGVRQTSNQKHQRFGEFRSIQTPVRTSCGSSSGTAALHHYASPGRCSFLSTVHFFVLASHAHALPDRKPTPFRFKFPGGRRGISPQATWPIASDTSIRLFSVEGRSGWLGVVPSRHTCCRRRLPMLDYVRLHNSGEDANLARGSLSRSSASNLCRNYFCPRRPIPLDMPIGTTCPLVPSYAPSLS